MKRERVRPSDWKDRGWRDQPTITLKEEPTVARGKHASASLHRRWQEATDQAQEWKKRSQAQAREIQALTADVNLIPAMKERIASLEMQLSLATCQEIESLNAIVASQHATIEELDASLTSLQKKYDRLTVKMFPRKPNETFSERLRQIDAVVNGDEATFEVLDVVIEDPTAPSKTQRRLGAEGVQVIERARRRR